MFKKSNKDIISAGKNAIKTELEGLKSILDESINDTFCEVIDAILNTKGRVIVSGMGKAGYVAHKFAATLASTGTPAFFVHPGEASHGDLGMIVPEDTVILISNSGGSKELNDIIDYCKRFSMTLIGFTRKKESTLYDAANIKVALKDIPETNSVKSPTTSMIMMVAYCDAIITALIDAIGFNNDRYKIFHPKGKLGSALIRVEELMYVGDRIPLALETDKMPKVLDIITEHKLGCAGILDSSNNLVGIITDGDIRRKISSDFLNKTAKEIMVANPITVEKNMFIAEAITLMNNRGINNKGITALLVVDPKLKSNKKQTNVIGILHMHDCIRAGVV